MHHYPENIDYKQELRDRVATNDLHGFSYDHETYVSGFSGPSRYVPGQYERINWYTDPASTISYSDLHDGWSRANRKERTEGSTVRLFEIPHTQFGDYCGSYVEASNCQSIAEEMGEGPAFCEAIGGFGSRSLLCAVDYLTQEQAKELIEIIDALLEYCIHDESLMSEMEMEGQTEQFMDWGVSDFKEEIQKAADHDGLVNERVESLLEMLDDDSIASVYWKACECSGSYPEAEAYQSFYFYPEKNAEHVTEAMLQEAFDKQEQGKAKSVTG